jgi:hypothetical protein
MIADIFGSKEVVRIFDFLLDDPLGQYTKSEIAKGASVSRPTVQKLVADLIKMGVLRSARKFGNTELLELDLSSPLVTSLMKFDSELSKALASADIDKVYPNPWDQAPFHILEGLMSYTWNSDGTAEMIKVKYLKDDNAGSQSLIEPIPSPA